MASHILRKLPDLSKSPSERYKLSKNHVRPVSKRLCIIFMACSCPNFVLGRLKKKKRKKMSVVFPCIILAMYFRQCYWVHSDSYTMVRYLKRLKSSRLGRVQAFPMYGGLGMSAPSLHRESTDSLLRKGKSS